MFTYLHNTRLVYLVLFSWYIIFDIFWRKKYRFWSHWLFFNLFRKDYKKCLAYFAFNNSHFRLSYQVKQRDRYPDALILLSNNFYSTSWFVSQLYYLKDFTSFSISNTFLHKSNLAGIVWNMFNNKGTRTMSLMSFWCIYC